MSNPPPTLPSLTALDAVLDADTAKRLAKQTRFCIRAWRKIAPLQFVRAACALACVAHVSLEMFAALLGFTGERTVSKQGVHERLGARATAFVQAVLAQCLAVVSRLEPVVRGEVFSAFGRVLIEDSTIVGLPARLASAFPGARNQRGRGAALKIDVIYNLLTSSFVSFLIAPFTRNDQSAAGDILACLCPGDLVIRDLGFCVLRVLAEIADAGAFFLSRLKFGTDLFSPDDASRLNLLALLRPHNTLDMHVLLGGTQHLPVRLVALPVPDDIAAARRRELRRNRDKRYNPSAEHLALLGWELFITNVPHSVWSTDTVAEVYALRYRIETIFKAWKSHFRLTDLSAGSLNQTLIIIYARLIWATIFQSCVVRPLAHTAALPDARSISMLRLASFFSNYFWLILYTLASPHSASLLSRLIDRHCRYDKRKRLSFPQRLCSLTLASP